MKTGPEGPVPDRRRKGAPASSASADRSPDGAEMLAMTKLRSTVGFTPSGRVTSLMWMTSPISRPVRSTVM